MKKFTKTFLSLLCATVFALPVFVGCDSNNSNSGSDKDKDKDTEQNQTTPGGNSGNTNNEKEPDDTPSTPGGGTETETIDYAGQLKLDWTTDTKKQEVTVRLFIDGDTTHFDPVKNSDLTPYNADDFKDTQGYIKARYLAVDTPESTGDIEKWGKSASNFTHDKLQNAQRIVVESDDNQWNIDSTGERYTLWIWYQPKGETEFRNLNVEILQNGFARASSTANNRYGTVASNALAQAREQKLHVFAPASVVDENFYEGDAIAVDLKTLRYHLDDYVQKSVRVDGIVVAVFNHSAYIEQYDETTDTCYGMSVYYGFQTGAIQDVLSVGNQVNVVGSVTAFNGTYQISGVTANKIRPTDKDSTIIGTGKEGRFALTTAQKIMTGKHTVSFEVKSKDEEGNDIETMETLTLDYAEAIMSTSVTVEHLKIKDMYTTHNGGDNDGAISIKCQADDGTEITVRTQVLTKSDGTLVTEADFEIGSYITVKGIVDINTYNGAHEYQVAIHKFSNIQFLDA